MGVEKKGQGRNINLPRPYQSYNLPLLEIDTNTNVGAHTEPKVLLDLICTNLFPYRASSLVFEVKK